jgi:SNF2 family DNA or RNA helicase
MNDSFKKINIISQPKELKTNLYQHQLASVYQMEERELKKQVIENNVVYDTNIGVNADKTGYGKTLSMVTLVYRDMMEWDMETPFIQTIVTTYASGRIKKTVQIEYEKLDTTLVLASQSIINQWYEEIHKTPLSVAIISTKKSLDTILVNNYDIILVTPTMYNRLVLKYSKIAWKRFIFDEPGHLNVPAMKKIIAGFNWLVTATPDAIISKHKNCRNSFMYDIIGSAGWSSFSLHFSYLLVKNTDDFIMNSFSMPPTNHIYYKCYNPIYNTVKGFVTSKITQMISAGNINGAIEALGGVTTDNIVELVRQKKILQLEEIKSRIKILTISNKQKHVDALLIKVTKLEVQINELDNRYKEILSGDCSICLEKLKKPVMETHCQNVFCGSCLLKWFETKETCPLCRDNVKTHELIYIDDGKYYKNKSVNTKQLNTKINTVINLIKNKPNGKFIIFSAWDQTFTPIRNILIKNNNEFVEVKGCITSRQQSIESFKNGNTNVIFLNSKNNGAGINLTETTDIIVYHDMSEDMLNQITGRANRIGRVESLNVHHLQI